MQFPIRAAEQGGLAIRFDRLIRRMTAELGEDPLILEAANSRTGRAFMLVARVTGAFD